MRHGGVDYAEQARKAVGNWRKFESFAWHAQPDDADNWCIVHTNNRDIRLMEQSNAAAIEEALKPFFEADEPDIAREHMGHWACGWVDGYSIRVFDAHGKPTAAFCAWCDIAASMEDYPLLDEEDYSRREYEATLANIESELRSVNRGDEYILPDDAASQLWRWLWDNNQRAVENSDDSGGYPSESELREACDALGWRILWVVRWVDVGEQVEEFDNEYDAEACCQDLRAAGIYATFDAELP
jgi:hypothetical protein